MTGVDNSTGRKADHGKPRPGLMVTDFADALTAVADIATFGAAKYAPSNWLRVPDASARYTDALYRHLFAHACGDTLDEESGQPHLAHAAWNLLAILQLEIDRVHPDIDRARLEPAGPEPAVPGES